MAQFRVECRGSRGSVSRLGGKKTGVEAHLKSWETYVYISLRQVDGVDKLRIVRSSISGDNYGEEEVIFDGNLNMS